MQEMNNSCSKKIAESQVQIETKLVEKIDQLMSMVSKCDSKIEAYNASMEEKIKSKISGIVKNGGFEKVIRSEERRVGKEC